MLGSAEAIRSMPPTVLTGYMGRNYTNSNVVVAATGKLQHQQILDLVQKHLFDLPGSSPPRCDSATYAGGEFREERDLDQVHVVLGFPSVGYSDPDRATPQAGGAKHAKVKDFLPGSPGRSSSSWSTAFRRRASF